jgi:glycosyltransferase involved in cell wall biosynthesis
MSFLTRLRRLSRALPVGPAVMHRLRRLAWQGFRASAWISLGRARGRQTPRPGPVCVVGFHGSVLGIGEAARAFSQALRQTGADVVDWDISARFGHETRLDGPASADPPAEASSLVIFLNPHELVQLVAMTGGRPFRERFCVGAWAWELERAPKSWSVALRYVDEVWAPSRFVAHAVAAEAPAEFPIRVLPHPVQAWGAQPDRAAFDLPEDRVVVLLAFDVRSGFTRKNPVAAVRAFRQARALAGAQAGSVDALLVCKVTGVDGAPALVEALRTEIGADPDVRLMTDWLTSGQMRSLIASADIVLSLHRSEGFGLLPAQAMAKGKAVVATGWSANLDYMAPDNAALVDYTLVPVEDPQGLYRGGRWAEAEVSDAAAKLAALIADAPARRAMGEKAAADIATALDPVRIGRMARGWLGQV